jgi:DNA mismatch repair ATPase MutS
MQEIDQEIQALKPDQHAFVLCDEPFTATSSKAGSEVLKKFIDKMGMRDKTVTVVVTFYKNVAKMIEQRQDSMFKNYSTETIQKPDGSFKRTYKIKPGLVAADKNDALYMARQCSFFL